MSSRDWSSSISLKAVEEVIIVPAMAPLEAPPLMAVVNELGLSFTGPEDEAASEEEASPELASPELASPEPEAPDPPPVPSRNTSGVTP